MTDGLSTRSLDEPAASRLALDDPDRPQILAAHKQAMEDGSDGYVDPVTGLMAFTATHLARQGACCDSNCRHCPYVDE